MRVCLGFPLDRTARPISFFFSFSFFSFFFLFLFCMFQLVFEGKKIKQESWSLLDDEIYIDDVDFKQSIISSPPTTSTTTMLFTTTTKQHQSTQHRATDASSPNHQTALQTATSQSSPVHSDNPATTVGTVLSSTPSGGKGHQ